MAQQELSWKVSIDPQIAAQAMRSLAAEAKSSSASIEASVRQEAQAAIALQRQRSAALVALWKSDTASAISEEKARTTAAIATQNQEFREIQSIHAAKQGLAAQEFSEIQKIHAIKLQMAAADARIVTSLEAGLTKVPLANYVTDLTKFQNALANNSTTARKAANDFLLLLNPLSKVGPEARIVQHEASQVTEVLRALGSSAVIAEGPLGGISSRLGALGAESTELTGLMGPLGAVIAVIGGGAVVTSVGLFELAKKTAEFGDDVFKAHEKTALSVETLSAFKIAGRDVGIELSTMTTGFVRFTNNLEQAAAGNKKFIDIFGKLGVTAFHDNDKALEQFLARFATLRTDQERTEAASEAFGLRFGSNLVEVFNRVGGNMEAFKAQLREVGLLMTTEEAEAAHQFSVDLERLGTRLSGISRIIGQETLPAFDAFFKTIEDSLKANETDWRHWGDVLTGAILSVETIIGGLVNVLNNLSLKNFIPIYGAAKALLDFKEGITSTADKLVANYNNLVNPPIGIEASVNLSPRFSPYEKEPKAKKARDTSAQEERKAIQEAEKLYREETEDLKHEYELRHTAFDEYIKGERKANQKRLDSILNDGRSSAQQQKDARREFKKETDRIDDEEYKGRLKAVEDFNSRKLELDKKDADIRIAAIKDAEDQGTKSHADAALEQIDIEQGLLIKRRDSLREEIKLGREGSDEAKKINQQIALLAKEQEAFTADASRKVRDAKKQDVDKAEKLRQQDLENQRQYQSALEKLEIDGLKIDEEIAKLRIDLLRATHASGLQILIAELAERVTAEKKRHEEIVRSLEIDRNAAIKKAKTLEDILAAFKEFNAAMKKEKDRADAAMGVISAEGAPLQRALRPASLDSIFGANFAAHAAAIRKQLDETGKHVSNLAIAFRALGMSIQDALSDKIAALPTLMDMINGAIDQTIQGLAGLVSQWILYGSIGPDAVRKVAAQVLVSFAQQAAVAALYYTAQGIVDLFFNPAQSAADFRAAAIWAGIAGGTALVGRVVAGNAFQSASPSGTSARTGGGSSGGGSSSSGSGQPSSPIVIGSQRQPVMHITVEHTYTNRGTIDSHIKSVIVKDLGSGNGEIRHAIVKEIGRP